MTSIIEKAARDAEVALDAWIDANPLQTSGDVPWTVVVRAVLETIQEPTPEMIEACDNFVVGCCNMSPDDIGDVWDKMITAALSEKE
jgi:hypothetical protein